MSPSRRDAAAFFLASVLAFAFLYVSTVRRLHFDEALVVRSGWLLTGRIPASPPFAMPATLLAGAAARVVPDPGDLFLALRLVTAAALLAALAWAARRTTEGAASAAAAVALTLLVYAFGAHGLEFRYDAAILVGLLVAFGLVVRARDADFALLGLAAAFVAAHHAKGLLLGAAVLAFGVARAGGDRRRLVRLLAGAGGFAAAWLALAAACGILPEVVATDVAFLRLGASAGARLWPWQSSMATTFVRDLAFWLAAFAAALAAALDLARRRPPAWREDPDVWALLFLAFTLGFPFVHPMPWPYMLALPAPFAAILLVRRAGVWARGRARLPALAAAAAAVCLQTFVFGSPVGAAYWISLASPREPEVEALRLLRRVASPSDRVFDPSGMVYFLPPCTRDWYVDSLFREGAREGTWMAEVPTLDPAACPWILFTYRLEMLPYAAKVRLAAGWERRAWGLGLRRNDPRLAELPPARRNDEITTFW